MSEIEDSTDSAFERNKQKFGSIFDHIKALEDAREIEQRNKAAYIEVIRASVDLAALGMSGNAQDVVIDPFSPRQLGTGDLSRWWIYTDVEMGRLEYSGGEYTYVVIRIFE